MLQRCRAVSFLEFSLEVSGVIIPDLCRDHFHGSKGRFEKSMCFFQPRFLEVLDQWHTHFALEEMAETRARQSDGIGYFSDINVTMKILGDKGNGDAYFGVHLFRTPQA